MWAMTWENALVAQVTDRLRRANVAIPQAVIPQEAQKVSDS
jgi:hypothetical protein